MKNFDRGTRFGELYDRLMTLRPVRVVQRESQMSVARFLSDFAANSCPVIFTNDTLNLQNVDPLKVIERNFGDTIVRVRLGDYADPENYRPEKRQLTDMSISSYMKISAEKSSNQAPPYAGNFTLPIVFLDTLNAGVPVYYPPNFFEPPTVWLGASGCITPLHRDSSDNFAIHLVGTKRWTIFPPQDAPYLYMSSVAESKGGDFATSALDLRKPDLKRHPLFQKAKGITFDVSAGETLYLPMGWSHYVENLTTSLMVNHWLSIAPLGVAALSLRESLK